ncbi:MAG TPA: SDR family oxidoreductase [Rhodanobacteraceae bacterium]|nr:SDR family oxidoreductase [Rhodanobacteraceae bacterium]
MMRTPDGGRPRALVTGASSGIGAGFARQLAARGCDLVLTARREDRLRALAEELHAKHGIDAQVIAADLSLADAPQRIVEELAHLRLQINILINNAGYGVPGGFLDSDWQTHADFIRVLMIAPTELCFSLLPAMRERGYGRIVNVASLAGLVPGTPGHTLYAAAKSYLVKFSESLALENRKHGVNVCALCPGFTYSEFHDVTGARQKVSKMPGWLWMRADEVVRLGLDAVERGRIVYVTGRVNRSIKTLFKSLPDRLALKVIARRARHFRVEK